MRRFVTPLALVLFSFALAGCGPAGGWLALLVALAVATLAGCAESHSTHPDVDADVETADAAPDAGHWEACCDSTGRLDSCWCPGGWSCNYGLGLRNCPDGSCYYEYEPGPHCGDADAGAPVDAGGTWETCCEGGALTSCFCPAGVECNYGAYTICADGSCTYGVCSPGVDAGPTGGIWEPCCVDFRVSSCFCPAGVACNYGFYTDCGDGTCTFPGATCP
jgi:hypothetical protein